MRSIGKVKIKKLKDIIFEVFDDNIDCSDEDVIKKLPLDWWDTWEMADQEIRRIIEEELDNLKSAERENI